MWMCSIITNYMKICDFYRRIIDQIDKLFAVVKLPVADIIYPRIANDKCCFRYVHVSWFSARRIKISALNVHVSQKRYSTEKGKGSFLISIIWYIVYIRYFERLSTRFEWLSTELKNGFEKFYSLFYRFFYFYFILMLARCNLHCYI